MYFTEYLPRLNTISVVTDVSEDFKLEEIASVSLITPQELSIQAKDAPPIKIKLPVSITEIKISGVRLSNNTLSFSIKLSGTSQDTVPFTDQTIEQWSCKDLTKTPKLGSHHSFKFVCRNCQQQLIDSSRFNFKDMPSELWYEMMDFWHCHKPENHEEHKKDYKGVLKPDGGTIIIGGYYLLERENPGIVLEDVTLVCKKCRWSLGEMYQDVMRIFKWNILLEYEENGLVVRENYNPGLFVYNLIVDKVNSTASRKFKVVVDRKEEYLWVMNLGVNVCVGGVVHDNALKVLLADKVEKEDDYELLDIPYGQISKDFIQDLSATNKLLPKSIQSLSMGSNKFIVSYLSYK
ncbi:hypothetical protein Cantr_04109 [Candida viswanathii]|uniref:Ubiquitin-conjugating enzyme E2-binding protein n=1 Tax=Candida viswanathii TaxID=5486 RepID=A0A367XPA9_9ASCO|nr:hypothetical protein Cantr_04109 [Candida viswanathii]